MKRDLKNRRMLLTGGSRGIGRALAEQLAAEGSRLVLAARSQESLDEAARSLSASGCEVHAIAADITRDDDRRRLLEAALSRLGGLDVLINNAGVGSFGHFSSSSEQILRQVMELNFFAPAELIRLAVPHLQHGQQPAIVNIASMCGRLGMPAWSEYSASKFALCGLTEALRGELVRYDVDILLVCPGLTQTELSNHMLRNEGRMKIEFTRGLAAQDVARAIVDVLRRNRMETVLGTDARWFLRINRFFPRLVSYLIARKVRKLYANP